MTIYKQRAKTSSAKQNSGWKEKLSERDRRVLKWIVLSIKRTAVQKWAGHVRMDEDHTIKKSSMSNQLAPEKRARQVLDDGLEKDFLALRTKNSRTHSQEEDWLEKAS
ncbi:hypothetical protein TNCV_2112941 [Trichonephila clavipes]|nr:hypothetical protein TNCV_2112941 [Trichonephila clavipes]